MTLNEINNEFDILYNNISSAGAPNLNEYEKSLFLTKAQDELVRLYYTGKNANYNSFESDEETRRYLDSLIRTKKVDLSSPQQYFGFKQYNVKKDSDMLFIVRETAENASEGCLNGVVMPIVPVTHEDINRIMNDPFKRPNERKVLRYDVDEDGVCFNLLSKYNLKAYTITYLKKPRPIVLEDLMNYDLENPEFSIDGEIHQSTPEIPDLLQHKVISRAVELAKATYIGDLNTTFAVDARTL